MKTRLLVLSASLAIGLAVYSGTSSFGSQKIRQAGIVYSDATLQSAVTAFTPRVYASASPDSVPGRYKYSYILVNEATSSNAVWKFVIDPVPRPLSVSAPPHWMWNYGYQLRDRALAFASEGDETPYGANWDSVSDMPSAYDLQPGDSITAGFVSDGTPSMTWFYAQGFYNDSLGTEDQGGSPPYSVYANGIPGAVLGPATTVGVPGTSGAFEPPPTTKLHAPATTSAAVAFYMPGPGRVQLGVYDITGRLVQMLADRTYPEGYFSVAWRGTSSSGGKASAGVYFFRLAVDGKFAGAKKMVTVR